MKKKSKKLPYKRNSKRKTALDRLLVEMIVKDYQPISVVDDDGFVKLVNGLDERYTIPCRGTITKRISKFYDEGKEALRNAMANVRYTTVSSLY